MKQQNGNGAAAQKVDPVALNLATRRYVLQTAQPMLQPLASATRTPAEVAAGNNVISFVPRNVGLLRGFWVNVRGTLENEATATQTANRTGRGVYNAVRRFTYWDLQNNQRVNTSGQHIGFLNTAKLGWGFGAAYAPNLPAGFGNNWAVNDLPATLADEATTPFSVWFYIPIAYSQDDLTGAIFTGVTGGTQRLTVEINANPGYVAGDALFAMMGGAGTNIRYLPASTIYCDVYQDYWDQLRRDPRGNPVLPQIDLGTSYLITDTALQGLVANQEFPIEFANYRKFLSTFVTFDNFNGSNGEAAFGVGADLQTIKLTTANYTNIEQVSPNLQALRSRVLIGSDWPRGVYYHDFRRKPIDTINYGSQQLTYTPISVAANAYLYVCWEAFADTAIVTQAGSLPGG